MAEYVSNPIQIVEVGQSVVLDTSIGCNKGFIFHRAGSGILTLSGKCNNPCATFARYQVTFNGNIAVPTGETVGEISLAIAIDGEPLQTSRARVTPAAVDNYFNVTSTCFITVPSCCCYTCSVENTSATPINVQNANLVVTRVA